MVVVVVLFLFDWWFIFLFKHFLEVCAHNFSRKMRDMFRESNTGEIKVENKPNNNATFPSYNLVENLSVCPTLSSKTDSFLLA